MANHQLRKGATAMGATITTNLYPVVHDLTEEEYCAKSCRDGLSPVCKFSLSDFCIEYNKSPVTNETSKSTAIPKRRFVGTKVKRSRSAASDSTGALEHSETLTVTSDCEDDSARFDEFYVLTRLVFRCDKSEIWECVHRASGQRYCVKVIDFSKLALIEEEQQAARREVSMLQTLQGHGSIVNLREVLEDAGRVHIIMELLPGGNLLSRVVQEGALPEEVARTVARSMLRALKHMHSMNCHHNGLEPSNLVFTQTNRVKIIDFGHASRFMCTRPGSVEPTIYTAPEVARGRPASDLSDMWSAGMILYYALSGHAPCFERTQYRPLLGRDRRDVSFPAAEWGNVSRQAKQFISSCLHSDPHVRLTADEALNHPWLANPFTVATQLPAGTIDTSCPCSWRGLKSRLFVRRKQVNAQENASSPSGSTVSVGLYTIPESSVYST